MNKTAKPLYTDPEDIKNYENRKRIRRNLITAVGGVGGGLSGAMLGSGIGMVSAGPFSRSSGRRELLGALLGLGVGATAGALGGRKLNDLHIGYMESAGLDPTIPHLKARLSVDGNGGAAKAAEAGGSTTARRNTMNKTAAVRSQARRAALTKAALDNVGSEIGGMIASPLSGATIGAVPGALIGALVAAANGKSVGRGIGAGALGGAGLGYAGSGLANLGGVLAAVIRDRRTKKQQQEHDSKSHWENFIPGVAAYNYTKRKGRVLAGVGEPDEEKAAEAAFAEGFCKAAEIAGVDPAALYKQAIAVGDVASLGLKAWKGLRGAGSAAAKATRNPRQTLATAKGMGSRYLELLRGGNAQAMAPVKTIGNNAAEAAEMLGGGRLSQGLARVGSRYGMAGGTYDTMAREGLRLGSISRADYANYLRGKGELRKVIGARAATAGGLLGGGVLAMHGGNEGQPQADQGALAKTAAGSGDHSTANMASEVAGFLSPAALDVLSRIALRRGRPGAAIAAGVGGRVAGLANLAGAVTGLAKDTRSNATQATHDSERRILKNLLPGVGAYNMWKRVGNKMRGE